MLWQTCLYVEEVKE